VPRCTSPRAGSFPKRPSRKLWARLRHEASFVEP